MFMYINARLLRAGFLIWAGATIALRFGGQRMFRPGHSLGLIILFVLSFPAMAGLVRRLCLSAGLEREKWTMGAASIALPTLMLDALSSALFPIIYPNMDPVMAGVFGGWILWCCAGAFAGAMFGGAGHSK
jgi:Family of unknown function (DUF5367)